MMKNTIALSVVGAALVQATNTLSEREVPTLNTPANLVTCEVTALSWTGGTAPFFVSVYPGGTQTNPLIQFAAVQSSPLSWNVNLTAGQSLTFGIKDGQGLTGLTGQVPITAGPDTSCVGASTGTTGGGSSSGSGSGSSNSTGSSGSGSSGGSSSGSGSSGSNSQGSSGGTETKSGSAPGATQTEKKGGAGMVKAGASTLALGALAALAYLF